MYPTLGFVDVDLGPNVVRPINAKPCLVTKSYTQTCEGIAPFSTAADPCVKQLRRMVIPRKSLSLIANLALVVLDPGSMPFSVLSGGSVVDLDALHVGICLAIRASWLIQPLEEVSFKPFQQRLKLLDLLAL